MTEHDLKEVVDAELVDDHLPARIEPRPAIRPLVDQHTILLPGQDLPTEADAPTYTERDLYVSSQTAERLKNHSKPRNTSKTYDSQRKLFTEWCEEMGRVHRPCTTATFIEYIAHLIEAERSPNTVSVAMSAIRTWMPDDKKPGTSEARGMLNQYRKDWAKRHRVKKAPAITDDMLRAMVSTCDMTHPIGIRDACVLLLGRGALNRRMELSNLTLYDVEVDDDGVALYIAYSKTDQAAEGEETFIPRFDDPVLDPVRHARAWFNMLHRLGVREGAFFRALTVSGTLQNRDTATQHGDHVTGDAINDWVRSRAYKAGVPDWQKVTAHGLRRGGAQAIANAGGDPTKQGRWKTGSAVVKREYLDRAQSRSENPWLRLAQARPGGGQ